MDFKIDGIRFASHLAVHGEAAKIRVCHLIEFGCGSANDYRMWAASGISSLLNYTGIDVSSANITNARNRFHEENFIVGDVCSLDAEDESFDVTVAFDVYEHLSPAAFTLALEESLRVTRDEHYDRVGVLAFVLEQIRTRGINVEEVQNIIFDGAAAASCRILLMEEPAADVLAGIKSGNPDIISVEAIRLDH